MPPRTLDEAPRQRLGRNLVDARTNAGLSIEQAVTRSGVPRSRLSLWENGREQAGVEGLLRLAVTYQCNLDRFFSGVDEAYDDIIERQVPIDAQAHFQAKLDAFIQRIAAGIQTGLGPGAPAPTSKAHAAARPKAHGKSAPVHARRKPPK